MKKEKTDRTPGRASRRRFAKTLAAAALAAPAALAARAQTPPATKEPTAPPNPQPSPTPAPPQQQGPPRPSPLAEAYGEAARLRFGEHLSPEQLQAVKRDLEGNVRTAERLRAFKLKNADEPDFAFEA
jgi:hypothetical protein